MKIFSVIPLLIILSITASRCKDKDGVYKGKLEVKGMCMNYTIRLVEGDLDPSRYVSEWKDETTGKTHTNVFALGSVCNFPDSIKQGDEFYFKIDSTYVGHCAVCMAYYPKPPKSIAIKIIDKK